MIEHFKSRVLLNYIFNMITIFRFVIIPQKLDGVLLQKKKRC